MRIFNEIPRCRTGFLYLLSPIDLVPEAVFGVIGLLDDAVVIALTMYATAAIFRASLMVARA